MKEKKKKEKDDLLARDPSIPLDSAVRLDNLCFAYEKKLNVKNFSVDIKRGEFVSVIGHNGSGKSTLAKLIDGILAQSSGEIYLFGVRMTDDNAVLLRNDIGLVFQNPDSQFIGATVRDDIAFGLENDCIPTEDMEKLIEDAAAKVSMLDYLDAEPSNLSGGQKQRVAIAGAVARHPRILILDEAGAMLDPKGKDEIRNIIRERKKEEPDLTVINITHEIEDAYDSDRVLVMSDGKLVLDGAPKDVFENDSLLKSISLDLPFTHKLRERLKELGLDVPSFNSEQELIDFLCR